MPAFSKKRRAPSVELDESEPEIPTKAVKKAKNASSSSQPDGKDDDGNAYWEV